jgi:hypothetical protein
VRQGLPRLPDAEGRQRPVQPGAPDGDILGTTLQAKIERARCLLECASADCLVCQRKPDPIIRGRRLAGPVEGGANRVDLWSPQADLDMQSNQVDRRLGRAFARAVQSIPARFDQAQGLLQATLR